MKEKINWIKNYFKETRSEMKKVVWPDRRYVMVASIVILVLVFLSGLYVMLVDFVFAKIFGVLIK